MTHVIHTGRDGSGRLQYRCSCGFTAYNKERAAEHAKDRSLLNPEPLGWKPAPAGPDVELLRRELEEALELAREEGYRECMLDVARCVDRLDEEVHEENALVLSRAGSAAGTLEGQLRLAEIRGANGLVVEIKKRLRL